MKNFAEFKASDILISQTLNKLIAGFSYNWMGENWIEGPLISGGLLTSRFLKAWQFSSIDLYTM